MNSYHFYCSDHSIVIKAWSEQEAWEQLGKILTRGRSEELYSLNDFKLEECSNQY